MSVTSCFHAGDSVDNKTYNTVPAEIGDLEVVVSFSGKVSFPNTSREAFLIRGTVGEIFVKEGDTVTQSQVLAKLSQIDITTFQARLEEIELEYEKALKALDDDIENSVAAQRKDALERYEDVVDKWLGIKMTKEESLKDPDTLFAEWQITNLDSTFNSGQRVSDQDDPNTRWNEIVVFGWLSIYPGEFTITCEENDPVDQNNLCIQKEIKDAWIIVNSINSSYSQQEILLSSIQKALEKTKTDIKEVELVSSVSGRVTDIAMKVGEQISDSKYITVENTDMLEINGSVPELKIRKLNEGMPIAVELNAYPGRIFQGNIKKIGSATGSIFSVVASFENPDKELILREGMNAFCIGTISKTEDAVIVPLLAIQGTGTQPYVLVRENGLNTQIPVTLGESDGISIVVESGITAGQMVVINSSDTST